MQPAAAAPQGEQLNRVFGSNTVQFHLDGTMPKTAPLDLSKGGGTPNQKTERWANRIACFHFVQPNEANAAKALQGTIELFQGQLARGHQCVGNEDEALTASHAPIWWRAILSLRITSERLARERGGDYKTLEQLVLQWLEHHTTLDTLGEIQSGPRRGEVWLPGARTGFQGEPNTDKITNVIHQMITRGAPITNVGPAFFKLSQDAPDRAGAALAKQIQQTIGFGNATGGAMPKLCNRLVVERFDDGHIGKYPDGIAKNNAHARQAWAHYPTGRLGLSKEIVDLPADIRLQGQPKIQQIDRAV